MRLNDKKPFQMAQPETRWNREKSGYNAFNQGAGDDSQPLDQVSKRSHDVGHHIADCLKWSVVGAGLSYVNPSTATGVAMSVGAVACPLFMLGAKAGGYKELQSMSTLEVAAKSTVAGALISTVAVGLPAAYVAGFQNLTGLAGPLGGAVAGATLPLVISGASFLMDRLGKASGSSPTDGKE